jgi:hypothetical protein
LRRLFTAAELLWGGRILRDGFPFFLVVVFVLFAVKAGMKNTSQYMDAAGNSGSFQVIVQSAKDGFFPVPGDIRLSDYKVRGRLAAKMRRRRAF